MKVGAKFAFCSSSFHCSDDLVAHHKTADVGVACFLDELLDKDVCIQTAECFDHGLGCFSGLRKHDSNPLSALDQLDNDAVIVAGSNRIETLVLIERLNERLAKLKRILFGVVDEPHS